MISSGWGHQHGDSRGQGWTWGLEVPEQEGPLGPAGVVSLGGRCIHETEMGTDLLSFPPLQLCHRIAVTP